ncbi:MAG: hypothetical protein ACI8W7_001720 [Gammaproteobacteria bacterium]|jgi:hypothetical protein
MSAFGSLWHEDLRGLIRDHWLILSAARGALESAQRSTLHTQGMVLADTMALIEQIAEHERKEHQLAQRPKSHS